MKHETIEDGLYLCKVRGLKHLDYAVLMRSGGFWWQYHRDFKSTEGWIGITNDIEIIKVIHEINESENDKQGIKTC